MVEAFLLIRSRTGSSRRSQAGVRPLGLEASRFGTLAFGLDCQGSARVALSIRRGPHRLYAEAELVVRRVTAGALEALALGGVGVRSVTFEDEWPI